jgi:hypothetical protein
MKKLFKNIKRTSFLLTLVSFMLGGSVFASSPKGRVEYVSGRAFLVSNGTTKVLKKGDHIYDLSDVITEEGSFISFVNYFDQQFHLAGSGHIKVMNQIVELKRGYMWLESLSDSEVQSSIQTPNAFTHFDKGQAIISYDQYSGKTQILSIKGDFTFGNIFQDHLKVSVPGGEFSFISKDYEEGSPRQPTPVGQSAFKKLTGLFSDKPASRLKKSTFTPKAKNMAMTGFKKEEVTKSRGIASVATQTSNSSKRHGKVTYRRTTQEAIENRENKMLKYYGRNIASLSKPKPKKKFSPSYAKKSSVKVKIFGAKKKAIQRVPASVLPKMKKKMQKGHRKPASINALGSQVEIKNSAFESSLIREYKKQMRHKKEVNSLINDLKSYDQDYKQAY